jgi:hypothetical protein
VFDEEEYAENWCRACQREKCLGQENCPEMAYAWGTDEEAEGSEWPDMPPAWTDDCISY